MPPCPSENSLILLLEKDLAPKERQRLQAHIRVCSRCFAAVSALGQSMEPPSDASGDGNPRLEEPQTLAIGMLFKERFEILRPLQSGCFGTVFLVRDRDNPARRIAIKVLKPHFLEDPEVVRRFEQEGKSLELLKHPHILQIFERGEWRGHHFILTEFIEGEALADWLMGYRSRNQRLPWREVLQIFEQLCSAMTVAHRFNATGGIVHRDLKPKNIMITMHETGQHATILDFGLARLGERSETLSGETIGTPGYMAPEQMGSQDQVGPWTDVYALGVILLEMLTLKKRSMDELPFWNAAKRDPRSLLKQLQSQCPEVPLAVLRAILPALSLSIEQRYSDAGVFNDALRNALKRQWDSARVKYWLRNLLLILLATINISQSNQIAIGLGHLPWRSLLTRANRTLLLLRALLATQHPSLYLRISNGRQSSEFILNQVPLEVQYVRVAIQYGSHAPYEEDIDIEDFQQAAPREVVLGDVDPRDEINLHVIAFGKVHQLAESNRHDPVQLGTNAVLTLDECQGGYCRYEAPDASEKQRRIYQAVWCDRHTLFAGGSNLLIRRHSNLARLRWNTRSEHEEYLQQFFGDSINNLYGFGGCPLDRSKKCPYPPNQLRNRLVKWSPSKESWDPLPIPDVAGRFWFAQPTQDGGLWVVGSKENGQGMILRRDPDGSWREIPCAENFGAELRDIWPVSSSSIWVAGSSVAKKGILLHKVGDMPFVAQDVLPTYHKLTSIWGSREGNMWLGSQDGIFFHYDGSRWESAPCAQNTKSAPIYVLLGRSDTDIWAAGEHGFLARYDGSCWKQVDIKYKATGDEGDTSWNAMFINGEDVCIAGGSGDILRYRYAVKQAR